MHPRTTLAMISMVSLVVATFMRKRVLFLARSVMVSENMETWSTMSGTRVMR